MLNDVRYSGYLAYRLLNACVKEGEYAKRRGYQMIIGISDWTVRGRWHYFELLLPENAEKQSERPEKQILSLEKIGVKLVSNLRKMTISRVKNACKPLILQEVQKIQKKLALTSWQC